MFTDPKKIHLGDKGNPDQCVVYAFHQSFNQPEVAEVERGCRAGTRGCVDCKKSLQGPMWEKIGPVHELRASYLKNQATLEDILAQGAKKARAVAQQTLQAVRTAMKLS